MMKKDKKSFKDLKVVKWVREHKKEIALVAGTAVTMILSKKLGDILLVKDDKYGLTINGYDNGEISLSMTKQDIFGNDHLCSPEISWSHENLLNIADNIHTIVKKVEDEHKEEN